MQFKLLGLMRSAAVVRRVLCKIHERIGIDADCGAKCRRRVCSRLELHTQLSCSVVTRFDLYNWGTFLHDLLLERLAMGAETAMDVMLEVREHTNGPI
jgi:hypothetical protein